MKHGLAVALIAIIVAAVLPFFLPDYRTFQLTMVLIYAIALLGLNILTGYNGQISLGHGAFFALGAYTAAIMMDKMNAPYWATLPVAGLVCLAVGFLFGLPALRLAGHHLALATLALAVALPQLLKYKHLEHWTGGVQGINLLKPDAPFALKLSQDQWLYLFTLAVAVVMFVLARNLIQSRIGRALIAIRDHPVAAEAMGVNNAMYKSITFGVSALYTGVAGALSAVAVAYVAPDSFPLTLSFFFLVGIVVGGVASIWGPIFGGFFIQFAPNMADYLSKDLTGAVYGVFLLLFAYVMPTGVVGFLKKLARRPA
jgi:branched-chain amino acid transport system permease protein